MTSSARPAARESLHLPPIPRTQALTSTTFHSPPLDGSMTVPDANDWNYEHSPNHPLFIYSDENGANTTITWFEAVPAIHRAGHLVRDIALKHGYTGRPVFGILAYNEFITYYTVLSGILRAGYTAFVISPRNSPTAVAHLLSRVSVSHLFVGCEDSLQDLTAQSFKLLEGSGSKPPTMSHFPQFDSLYSKDSTFEQLPKLDVQWDDPALTMHSSGSTAFPKPLTYSHRQLMSCGIAPYFGERDLTGNKFSCHSVPMFHGFGVVQLCWTGYTGTILTAFKPQTPTILASPENVMKGSIDTQVDYIFCVPTFLEAWSHNPAHVDNLKSLKGVGFTGGPLSKAAGDLLVKQGVTIFPLYGFTEAGFHSVILPEKAGGPDDWSYFSLSGLTKPYWLYDDDGNAELVLLAHPFQTPCVINIHIDGQEGYRTNDIMTPHPTKPGYWKIYGRTDDQIMHSTGEKTNPTPLETILQRDPHVQAAVIFGRGRFNAGVVVDPKPVFKFDPADKEKLAEFRNTIWPTVEKMNAFAPQHSRIFKEMIMVSIPNKPFTYTAKNTARRQAIISDYAAEIDALYEEVEQSAQTDIEVPGVWDLTHVTPFVREVLHKVLTTSVEDTDDIFLKGCDSLQATYIRNTLFHALKAMKVSTRSLPNSFVYQYPSVIALSAFLVSLADSDASTSTQDLERITSQMMHMLEKYSSNFPSRTKAGSVEMPVQDTVVVTGTTGGLGAAILVELVMNPEVEHVYALNRKGDKSLVDRHWTTFKDRGLDVELLKSPKVTLLEAATEDEGLGLPEETFEQIRNSATHIVHNAWPVNFNMTLSSFEPNVQSVRRLLDLALTSPHSSPTRLLFVSSVGVLRNIDGTEPVAEGPVPATVPIGYGYSESKWVAENLIDRLAKNTSLKATCVRVGQLSGSASGAWSQTEWLPSLIKSSVTLGALPSVSEDLPLIPADAAARAIVEMRNSNEPYLHLAHPEPTPMSGILEPVSRELSLPMVPYDEWLSLLERSAEGLDASSEVEVALKNPALKLLDFFAQGRSSAGGTFGLKGLDVSKARKVSRTLDELPPLTEETVLSWIAYWQSVGFL